MRSVIIKIFAYSAIKISAKLPALYSTLKPDTSSDSPSDRSKGVRFVSARIDENHIIANGNWRKSFGVWEFIIIKVKSKDPRVMRSLIKIRARLTS